MISEKDQIKKGKIGLLFWLISSFLGSVSAVEIQRYYFNKIPGFHFSFSDGILFWFIIMLFVLLVSSPLILIIYQLVKKELNLSKVLMVGLSIGLILSYFITRYFTGSYYEALYIVTPYFVFAFILGFVYLKMERSITASKRKPFSHTSKEYKT
jgi:hypothetical protein